ncbi:3-isopropylmalate dehydratase small subunit [Gulosibacter molinativorax]|uniref:3-isopropylmalate dehydratase small subunit n=1 Tax=Gulosibacter molinativorax TaxID=256821 RepID=A0ABT7C8Q2_9MICO|nr:3-isopropylmalate dehydratase small subunit [Gulosibacter molinativorax]MDJ1371518.1 3-isopropylmalate dehydratase small subunit [Gulosibacter molinativorax]QUY62460.1 3-isopropylmalate dehydratase small subunit [Gulosibacter molinativorax]
MEKINNIAGKAVPLRRSNVDTDQIIPAVFLKRVTKTGFDDALFYNWRQDPEFVLNQPRYANPRILVAGHDFGTGSSREHAVWALRDYGFRAVFGSRFGEIFRGNAGKQGLLVGVLEEDEVEQLWEAIEANPEAETVVSLEHRTVAIDNLSFAFEIDEYTRWRLMEGLDDIALTLRDEDAITAFEQTRPSWMPKTLPALADTEPGNLAGDLIELSGGTRE